MQGRWAVPVRLGSFFFGHRLKAQKSELGSPRHLSSSLFRLVNKTILNLSGNFDEPLFSAVSPLTVQAEPQPPARDPIFRLSKLP